MSQERARRRVTQKQVADALGVSAQALSYYELKKIRMPDAVAADLARLWDLRESDVRRRVGLYVPGDEGESRQAVVDPPELPENVLILPEGVKLTDRQQRALEALLDSFLDDVGDHRREG